MESEYQDRPVPASMYAAELESRAKWRDGLAGLTGAGMVGSIPEAVDKGTGLTAELGELSRAIGSLDTAVNFLQMRLSGLLSQKNSDQARGAPPVPPAAAGTSEMVSYLHQQVLDVLAQVARVNTMASDAEI